MKKAAKESDQTSTSASNCGTSKQADTLPPTIAPSTQPSACHSDQSEPPKQVCLAKAEKHADKQKHKIQAKYISQSLCSEEDLSSIHMKRSSKPQWPLVSKTNLNIMQIHFLQGRSYG